MAFSGIDRVLVENSGTNLNREISKQLAIMDKKAAELRAEGKLPLHEMSADVTMLEGAVARLTAETIEAIDNELSDIRSEWEKNRDRHADLDLARLSRASNRIGALSDDQCVKLADEYLETGSLNEYEVNELAGRFRQAGLDADLAALHRAAGYHHGDSPWMRDNPEAIELKAYRDRLSSLKGGTTFFENREEDVYIEMPVRDLVDYHGELDGT